MNLSILKPMNSQNVPTVGTKRPNENINENTIKRSKSNHQKKNVVNFCEENGIQYIPVVVRIVEKNGKKTKALKRDFLGMPDVNDFSNRNEQIQMRIQKLRNDPGHYTHIAIDTRTIFQVDIDSPDYSDDIKMLLETHPYTRSSTKDYGRHIFIDCGENGRRGLLVNGKAKKRMQFKKAHGEAVELLSGQWAWCPLEYDVCNADASFNFTGLKDMLQLCPPRKQRVKQNEAKIVETYSDGTISHIKAYIQGLSYIQLKNCDVGGIEFKQNLNSWEVKLNVNERNYCPSKYPSEYGACNNHSHNPSIVISPTVCRIDCFNASTNINSDCYKNALRWKLPIAKSKQFFGNYHADYEQKYGIPRDHEFDVMHDEDFSNLFMHSYKDRIVLCNGRIFERNEYGIFKLIAYDLNKIVGDFFKDFITNSECIFRELRYEIKTDVENKTYEKDTKHPKYKKLKIHKSVVYRLKNTIPLGKIVKWIKSEITYELCYDLLDSHEHLLGFENGVIDLNKLNLNDVNAVECVRNSAVDEFVSMSCGYEFKWATDEACQVWMDIFRKSYESQDEMDYDWIQLARCLEGNGNPEETAHIEYGGGANGKGLKSTGTISALGPYCATLSNSCLVYNRYKKKDGHDINLWTARKARVWLLSEMNEGENIDMEQFKRMTGSDPIAVRTHQQKEMTYIMAPPIRISLNHLPVLKGNKEESLQRRIEAKVYKQTFVSKDKYEKLDEEEKKTHYVIDTTLKGQMKSKEVKCIIMTILIKYFKRFKNKQFTVPASIVADTKWFLDNTDVNDKYKEWFDTNVIQDQGKGYNVVVCHLLKYFNSENNTKFNSRQFYKKLKYFGYEIKNSSGFPLTNDHQGNFTRQSEKLKTTCIIKVTLPHVQTFDRI